MNQYQEAFPAQHSEPYQDEKKVPENGQSAVILTFPQSTKEETVIEQVGNFEEYETLGGKLNKTEYQDVLNRATS